MGLSGPHRDDLVPAARSNERGHWESEAVHMCNVRILAARGGDTYAPPPPVSGWSEDPLYDPLRAEAAAWFMSTYEGKPLVLKDPRLCVTLPIWKMALPAPLPTIFVLRDPLEVARSLQARDELPIVLGLALWDRYIRSAVLSLENSPTLVVNYADMVTDPVKWTDVVFDYLEAMDVDIDQARRSRAPLFLDVGLRHQMRGDSEYEPLIGPHREIHDLLVQRSGTHSIWKAPELPATPPWADYVLDLRREVVLARHELYWTKSSRIVRAADALWHLTGRGPRRPDFLHQPPEDVRDPTS
jgi:hypothetical protein